MSLVACLSVFVFGAPSSGFAVGRSDGAQLLVNEAPVLRIRTGAQDLRASTLARRLNGYSGPANVQVRSAGKQQVILLDGMPLLAVSPAEARAQSKSAAVLASEWSSRLRRALQLPEVRLTDEFARLPVSGKRRIAIFGREARSAKIENSHPTIVKVERRGNHLELQGLAAGQATVSLQGTLSMETLDVEVRDVAVRFPLEAETVVTGGPATVATVRGAVESAVKSLFRNRPEVRTSFSFTPKLGINAGQSGAYRVKVNATAPNTYPSTGEVVVKVKNAGLDRLADEVLWYSNDPESVRQPGPLFAANLQLGKAARLLYHHQNASGSNLLLRVQAVNDSDTPARLAVIPGDSKPTRNPVRAGLSAGDQYIRNWVYGSAEIIVIPPRSSVPISIRRLYVEETASGLCSLRLVDGPPELLIRADAWPPFVPGGRWREAVASSTPWREVGASPIGEFDRAPFTLTDQIYPNPSRKEEVTYQVGGRHGFVRLGQRPIPRQDGDTTHSGNFGVVYTIKTKLINPTSSAVDVELIFESSAGYAAGFFFFNGRTIRAPLLPPKTEFQIARLRLVPGESKSLDMVTMPLSGSSYPATLRIRPVVASNRPVTRASD